MALIGFGVVTAATVVVLYLLALKRLWPARRPVMVVWAVYALDAVGAFDAIAWLAAGLAGAIGPVIPP